MKKRVSLLTAILMFLLVAASCGSGESSSKTAEPEEKVVIPTHQLYLDVEFEPNFMFDIYDVDVYVDNTKLGNIPHGEYFTALTEVELLSVVKWLYSATTLNIEQSYLQKVACRKAVHLGLKRSGERSTRNHLTS